MRNILLCSAASIVAIALSCPALAQEAPPSTGPAPSSTSPATAPVTDTATAGAASLPSDGGLGDIIVTAQRRAENLQRAAIPVDVISAQGLLQNGVTSPESLGTLVPALTATPGGGSRLNFFLRGVGNFTANPLFDSAIAVNYDNVYIGRPGSTGGLFYDLERVEVLKGPQGTLYGRNATGGAINILPVQPKLGEFSGYLTGSYGNYDAASAEGAINVPLGSKGALRASGNITGHDGYLSDGTSDDRTKAFRVQMKAELTPDLTVRISGDYASVRGKGPGVTYVNSFVFNPVAGRFIVIPSGLGPSVGIYDPAAQAYRNSLSAGPAGRKLTNIAPFQFIHNDYYGANAEISLRTGAGTLTVIPAWRYSIQDNVSTSGGFIADIFQKSEQYSVEARFAGDRIGPIDYTIGGIYFYETINGYNAVGQQALANFQNTDQRTTSYAGFARVTGNITDKFRLVGGVRFTHDNKRFVGNSEGLTVVCLVQGPFGPSCPTVPLLPQISYPAQVPPPFILPPLGQARPVGATGAILVRSPLTVVNDTFKKSRVTYRGAVEYDIGPRSLLYASIETGFRAGGVQPVTGYETYAPEYITAYTVGSKNRFFNNRLQLNVEGFLWKYRDQQLASITADSLGRQGFFVKNIGRSTNYGVETEARLRATSTTILSANVQYLHTKYDRFTYIAPKVGIAPPFTNCRASINAVNPQQYDVDCSGFSAYNAPRWTVNLGGDQTVPLGEFKVVGSLDTQYRSSRYVGFEFAPGMLVGSTWQTNAQISFGPENDKWSISAFIRNIENDRFAVNAFRFDVGSAVVALTNPPRTYGVRGSVKF